MSFNQCQECWEQNDNLKENNRVLSENLRESNDKRFELFEKVGELNKAYADLKAENEKNAAAFVKLHRENEKLRKLLTNITKEQSFNEFEMNVEKARQALGEK